MLRNIDEGTGFFNKGDFFEAHEAWEAVWRRLPASPEKRFLGGLIMVSAGLHHYIRGEYRGAIKFLEKGMDLISENRQVDAGMDTETFLKELRSFYERYKHTAGELQEERIAFPKIKKPHYV